MGEGEASPLETNAKAVSEIFRVSYYHYLFLYKINKIIQSDSLSCCWRILSVLVSFVTRRIARRYERIRRFSRSNLFLPTRKTWTRTESLHISTTLTDRLPLKLKSLQKKDKIVLSAILCAIWNFKEKHSANSFTGFGFCAFLCMSASNLFLLFHLIVNYFFSTSKRGKKASL